MKVFHFSILSILCIALFISGCTHKESVNRIAIAEQFGLAYAPIQIMKEKQFLEDKMPQDTDVRWIQLANTAAIRESMIAGDLDIGFMAIPPFLIGWDKGMEWKIATGLCSSPLGLVTHKSSVQSIQDLTSEDRIALPQPGSIQHILLSMACQKTFNNPQQFDAQLVTMSHPDGMNALMTKQDISAHFTSPPYLNKALKINGIHQILSGKEAMGKDFSFIVGTVTQDFYDTHPSLYASFTAALDESIDFIQDNPTESAQILSKHYNLSQEETLEYIQSIQYTSTVKGLTDFAEFMVDNGYLDKTFSNRNDVLFEGVLYEE